jgi:hypothetical protein
MVVTVNVFWNTQENDKLIRMIQSDPEFSFVLPGQFRAARAIFLHRFMNNAFVPKLRQFQHGTTPLVRGIDWDGNNPTYREPQFMPSLVAEQAKYAIRRIHQQVAEFGTSYPWAMLLHKGGKVDRIRISPKHLGEKRRMPSIRMSGMGGARPDPRIQIHGIGMGAMGGQDQRGLLRWRDNDGVWQKADRTEDFGAFFPPRPILEPFTQREMVFLTQALYQDLNNKYGQYGMEARISVGTV